MTMTTSEQIDQLATALAKAQADMEGAKKDSQNPHFKSKYADLAAIREACIGPLTKNGLSVVQSPRLVAVGEASWMLELETRLLHASGQWMADVVAMPLQNLSPQGVGSAITYARRYALAAFSSVAPEDDDAEGAHGRGGAEPAEPAGYQDWFDDLMLTAQDGSAALKAAWEKSRPDYKVYLTKTNLRGWEQLKREAGKVGA